MSRTPQQIGASNRRTGKDFQEACAADMRTKHGYPGAEYVNRNGVNDLSGTGDVAVEATTEGWDKIWAKLAQAERDAKYRGPQYVPAVWKKYVAKQLKLKPGEKRPRRPAGPSGGVVLMDPDKFWPLMRELEAYKRADLDAQDAYDRGYAAALKAQ